MKTTAIVFTGVKQVAVLPVEIPEPGAGEVLLEALYTLISPGTELRCRAGLQAGVQFPFIPGYSFVGRVIGRGPGATLPDGAIVYCGGTERANIDRAWGGHIAHAVHREDEVYLLPANVSPLHGTATRLIAIAYRGVRLSQPRPHETVAVVGLGAIGLLAAQLYALSGARVIAADLSPFRVKMAQQAGVDAVVPQGSLADAFAPFMPGGADIVVDATGVAAVLPQALDLAKDKPWDDAADAGARLVVQGSYAGDFSLPYMPAFMKEISLHVPRDVQPRDLRAALELLARGKVNPDVIISASRAPAAASEAYAALANAGTELITTAFDWSAL